MNKIEKILLIDPAAGEDNVILQLLKVSLGSDINIETAPSVRKGLIAIDQKKPDILIIEYDLSHQSGKDVLKAIANMEGMIDIPTIVTTELVDDQIAIDAIKHGAHEYISKSYVCESTLNDTIEKAMARVQTEARKQVFLSISEGESHQTINKLKALTTRISLLTNKARIAHNLANAHNLEENLAQLSSTIVELDKQTDVFIEEQNLD